jgi:peroxiredoxin
MKKLYCLLLIFILVGCATVNPNIDKPAPAFALVDLSNKVIRLADFKGKNLVLVFYVNNNWMPCLTQLGELQDRLSEIRSLNAEVIAISCCGDRIMEENTRNYRNIKFSIIPAPNRATAEAFGVWNKIRNLAIATIILDKNGVIRYVNKSISDYIRPSASDVIEKLNELNKIKR